MAKTKKKAKTTKRARPAAARGRKAAKTSRPAARKSPARKSPARKTAARKSVTRKTAARKSATRKTAARKTASRKAAPQKRAARPGAAPPKANTQKPKKPRATTPGANAPSAAPPRATKATASATAAVETTRRAPTLDRERRTVREEDMPPSLPSSLDLDRSASSARTGRAEYAERLREHTSTGPAMTGGDVDADWEDAETVGDEAPGGDNPTPDQDVVDEIGRALGIEYEDDEELQGGDEVAARDRHRWELDPASKDDFDEE